MTVWVVRDDCRCYVAGASADSYIPSGAAELLLDYRIVRHGMAMVAVSDETYREMTLGHTCGRAT